jgi:cathepsin C
MEEVYKNGPVVVSFEPDYNFMMYKSGIYHSIDSKTWINKGLPKPEWQKVDHSVLLVGWGEESDTGEKYWIIQNTWGPQWGENGFFRMKRGTDEYGIESICEAAYPLIIDNRTGRQLPLPSEPNPPATNGNVISRSYQNMRRPVEINSGIPSIFDVFNK